MPLPVENESELVIGGFQGIVKVRGLLTGIDVQDAPEEWENREKQVVRVDMEDTVVLEMFGDEEPMELKDGKFNFLISYAKAGEKPHKNGIYNKCWLESAKALGKVPSQFIGEYVTLEKQIKTLFDTYVEEDDVEGNMQVVLDENDQPVVKKDRVKVHVLAATKEGLPNHFCFVADETADAENVVGYIGNLVTGLNQKAALRKLLVDQKAKQFPEYKDMLNAGTLAEYLGLYVVDGIFVQPEGATQMEPVTWKVPF